jgi:DNA-binding MarR family transcriptional regulator
VLKKSDVEDKRVQRIFLTSKSKDLRPKLSEARDQTNEDLLRPFRLEEKVLLKRLLRDIQN